MPLVTGTFIGRVYRRVLPLRARNWVRQWRRPGGRTLVSVVIPVYNVEEYLAACLDSLQAQTHQRLDIIVVDDGSPDDSISIARHYARRDRRIRIIRQPNGGLSAARNTGVAAAKGEMLCFLDSDDEMPPRAIALMADSLARTGSDFALGTAARFTPRRRWIPNWAREVHAEQRIGCRIDEFPEVLKDVFVWNKMFRRAFFTRVVGAFPPGLYEDQEPTAKCYLAGTFDVLTETVYHWRERDDDSSITQQKADPRDLTARLVTVDRVSEVMRAAPDVVRRHWQAKTIGFDLRKYYDQVPRTDDAYWAILQPAVGRLAARMDDEAWLQVDIGDRLLALAVAQGNREAVRTVLVRRDEDTWKVHGEVEGARAVIGRDYLEGLEVELSDDLRQLSSSDTRLIGRISRHGWRGRVWHVEGYAYLSQVDLDRSPSRIGLAVVDEDGVEVPFELEQFDDPEVDLIARDAWNTHRGSGFRASLDTDQLDAGRSWTVRARVQVEGLVVVSDVVILDTRMAGRAFSYSQRLEDGRWAMLGGRRQIRLEHQSSTIALVSADVQDRQLTVTVRGIERAAQAQLRLRCRALRSTLRTTLVPQSDGTHRGALTLPRLGRGRGRHTWTASAILGEEQVPIGWNPESGSVLPDLDLSRSIAPASSRRGNLIVQQSNLWGCIDEIELVGDEFLRVRGRRDSPVTLSIHLDGPMTSPTVPLAPGRGSFVIDLPLTGEAGQPLTRARGYAIAFSSELHGTFWPPISQTMLAMLPVESTGQGIAVTCSATPKAGAAWIVLRVPMRVEERSRYAQKSLQRQYLESAAAPSEAVLFECFNGRAISDSPLALCRVLAERGDLDLYWSVENPAQPVPAGTRALLRFSKEWYEVLGRATHLVNNNNWPYFFRKKPHQRYLQTWHGTPLKRIGNDVPGSNLSLSYRALMEREAATWDALIAQNQYSAEIFPGAFGYAGEIFTDGYPRNDALIGTEAASERDRVRRDLGLGDGPVVLYAPTWRDNLKGVGGYGRVEFLDAEALLTVLPAGATVMVRGHANTAADASGASSSVIDVTTHPDINQLMLAADLLITDYSSLMFDFCVTGRPIYFLVPDLDLYRDTTRGFYVDLEEIAPGPVCRTQEDLDRAIGWGQEWYEERFGTTYRSFVSTFAPLDDGEAAVRVVDRFWGK